MGTDDVRTDEEWLKATAAYDRQVGTGGLAWMQPRDLDTGRKWGRRGSGVRAADTRGAIKNNTEYHGLENHGWQYLVSGIYEEASDYFYSAAVHRQQISDNMLIGDADDGHQDAVMFCLKVARFAESLVGTDGQPWNPEDFGLDSDVVDRRLEEVERILDEHFAEVRAKEGERVSEG